MTDAIERSSDVPVDEVVATGERLKQAREVKGVSVEDAAARLNISAKYIAALEAADMQALPGLPFVRGYIRSYSRYLNLPGDELIASFNHEMGVVDAQKVTTINKVGSQVKLSDTPIRLSVYLFFLAVVGISIWWWQTQSGHSIQDLINFDTTAVFQEPLSEEVKDSEESTDEDQAIADPTDIQTRLAARQQQLMEQSEQIEAENNALTSQQD
ncbi:MAG: helix-turn-helix domain-containing protein, partial [Motiliproteus sp.]|nr:helix-turn-helix domain-containing protein [Motiliproteus sp.]